METGTEENEETAARELRILLIEDSEADAEFTLRRLKAAGFICKHRCVVDEAGMRRELKAGLPDIILSDFSVPGFNGMSALAIAREAADGVPFIFLSGTLGANGWYRSDFFQMPPRCR